MELTIDQALQKAVEAHKAGKLQDAESQYRAILQAQPNHPDANHNLGVLAVSVNKSEAALPLFITALEANPNQGQFWLSYIDALIKEKQFDNARNVLSQAKKSGLSGEKVDELEAQLTASLLPQSSEASANKVETITQQRKKVSAKKEKKKTSSSNQTTLHQARNPSQVQLNALLEHYQKGQYDLAENLAKEITQKYPDHPFGWKVLGAVFKQTGRLQDSLVANERALAISPNDEEVHSNLGGILTELGRLKEAEASCRNAIKISPDFVQAHYNLGITLQQLGRLEEAETSYKTAIVIRPNLTEAHYKLGILLFNSGRYDQATKPLKLIKFKNSQSYLLSCRYHQNEKANFYELLDTLLRQGDVNPIIGSITSRAQVKYGITKPNLFCQEPFTYVFKINLNTSYDFLNTFIKPVKTILSQNERPDRLQNLLINGRQTLGNLFDIEYELTEKIEKTIRIEIEKYRTYFKDSEEGFIKKWPAEYSLKAWLIIMKSGGKLRPHMHENGWISGSIYINVPPKSNANSGNLVVCIDDQDYLVEGKTPHEKIIDVTTGSLCLFPASLLHYTIPFESDEERIVLAFDVIPKS
jgi:tetratricopeptide (TPR) repeat protein